MIGFAWVQTRLQAVIATTAFALLAVVMIVTGIHLVDVYYASVPKGNNGAVLQTDAGLQQFLDLLVLVVPVLMGLFWGAPALAREFETGTYRLAWTQSVSRTQWAAVKVGLAVLSGMALTAVVSIAVTWWWSPINRVNLSPAFSYFDQRDIVPVAYAAFAVALGAALGVVIRRTVPAMAATLAAFVAVRIPFNYWVRPNLFSPSHLSAPLTPDSLVGFGSISGPLGSSSASLVVQPPTIPGAWNVTATIVDRAGIALTPSHLQSLCPQLNAILSRPVRGQAAKGALTQALGGQLQTCAAKVTSSYHLAVTYQPGSHYWPIQWIEFGIYLAAAALLGGFCVWWVRRRIA